MPIDFLRPRFTETEQKIFGVEWVLLHVDTLPNFFNALSWANTFLLLPCGFVNDWYFLAVLVQCVRLAAFNSPFALGVDGAICNEYMGMVIFFFTPVMYGIGGGISILGQIVPDVVLDDGFIFCQSQLLGKCYLNFFRRPCVVGGFILLDGIEKRIGVGVFGRSGWRQDCSCYQYTLLAAVGVGRACAVIMHFLAADISERGTGRRAFGSTYVGYGAMIDCHVVPPRFPFPLGERTYKQRWASPVCKCALYKVKGSL